MPKRKRAFRTGVSSGSDLRLYTVRPVRAVLGHSLWRVGRTEPEQSEYTAFFALSPRASFWALLHAALSHRSHPFRSLRTRNARHHAYDDNPPQPAGGCRGRRLHAYAAATTTAALRCRSAPLASLGLSSPLHLPELWPPSDIIHPPTHPLLTSPSRLHACAEYPPGGNNRLVSRSPPAPPTTLPCPDPRPHHSAPQDPRPQTQTAEP